MPTELRDFLTLSYDELEQLNLKAKEQRGNRVAAHRQNATCRTTSTTPSATSAKQTGPLSSSAQTSKVGMPT